MIYPISILYDGSDGMFIHADISGSVIIALMLDSGIRQKEVCELQKADIDKERMLMKVTGKGAKDRLVPLWTKYFKFNFIL